MSELRFHIAARREVVASKRFYEAQRPGYGEKFETEFDALVERIVAFPDSGALLAGYPADLEARGYRMRSFRHVVIVAAAMGVRTVIAVAHTSRRPGYWSSRL